MGSLANHHLYLMPWSLNVSVQILSQVLSNLISKPPATNRIVQPKVLYTKSRYSIKKPQSNFLVPYPSISIIYILKQWIALNAGADWLVKLRISCAIYLRATREEMASRFASVTSEENIQINFLCCILSHCFGIY